MSNLNSQPTPETIITWQQLFALASLAERLEITLLLLASLAAHPGDAQ